VLLSRANEVEAKVQDESAIAGVRFRICGSRIGLRLSFGAGHVFEEPAQVIPLRCHLMPRSPSFLSRIAMLWHFEGGMVMDSKTIGYPHPTQFRFSDWRTKLGLGSATAPSNLPSTRMRNGYPSPICARRFLWSHRTVGMCEPVAVRRLGTHARSVNVLVKQHGGALIESTFSGTIAEGGRKASAGCERPARVTREIGRKPRETEVTTVTGGAPRAEWQGRRRLLRRKVSGRPLPLISVTLGSTAIEFQSIRSTCQDLPLSSPREPDAQHVQMQCLPKK
jgi:hypothetical protein